MKTIREQLIAAQGRAQERKQWDMAKENAPPEPTETLELYEFKVFEAMKFKEADLEVGINEALEEFRRNGLEVVDTMRLRVRVKGRSKKGYYAKLIALKKPSPSERILIFED